MEKSTGTQMPAVVNPHVVTLFGFTSERECVCVCVCIWVVIADDVILLV